MTINSHYAVEQLARERTADLLRAAERHRLTRELRANRKARKAHRRMLRARAARINALPVSSDGRLDPSTSSGRTAQLAQTKQLVQNSQQAQDSQAVQNSQTAHTGQLVQLSPGGTEPAPVTAVALAEAIGSPDEHNKCLAGPPKGPRW